MQTLFAAADGSVIGRGEGRERHRVRLGIKHQFQPAHWAPIRRREPRGRFFGAVADRRTTGGAFPRHAARLRGL